MGSEFNHRDLELYVKERAPQRSFLSRVVVSAPVIFELDNLSAQEAGRYLEQRKLLDRALRHSQLDLQKLAGS